MKKGFRVRNIGALCAVISAGLLASEAKAQLTLSGTQYFENFDLIGSGLPTGWTGRTGATSGTTGAAASFTTAATSWGDTGGGFKNVASSTGLSSSDSTATQSNATDRAFGIRQTASVGDPGAAFTLQLASTSGRNGFALSLSLEMLSVQVRSTTWSIQYGIGVTPSSFVTVGTYADPGTFGVTPFSYSFGTALDNISDNIWIRVVALSAATGSGSRDTFAIDDFNLTWSQPGLFQYFDANGTDSGIGGTGTWDTTSTLWSPDTSGTTGLATYAAAKPAIFAGTAGVVDVTSVDVNGGVEFQSNYTLQSGTINMGATTLAVTGSSVVADIESVVSGTSGWTKTGSGTAILGNANTFSGGVTVASGTLEVTNPSALGATNDVVLTSGVLKASGSASSFASGIVLRGTGGLSNASPLTITGTTDGNFTLSGTGSLALNGATNRVTGLTINAQKSVSLANSVTLAGNITSSSTASGSQITASGTVDMAQTFTTLTVADGAAATDLTFSAQLISGTSARFHKLGDGTARLTGDWSGFTGGFRVGTAGLTTATAGVLEVDSPAKLGTQQLQFNSGTIRALTAFTGTNAVAVSSISVGAGQTGPATFDGDFDFTGPLSLFKPNGVTPYRHTIQVLGTVRANGGIASSSGTSSTGLSLTGVGTFELPTGTVNTFADPIYVAGATFAVNGSLSGTGSFAVNVQGGRLIGTGTIANAVTIGGTSTAAVFAPGLVSQIGTFTTGTFAMSTNSTLELQIDSGLQSTDLVRVLGTANLGSGVAQLSVTDFGGVTLAIGTKFSILASNAGVTGFFNGLAEGGLLNIGPNLFQINYNVPNGGTFDTQILVVPEPGVLLLAGLGVMALGGRRRRL